MSTAKRSRRQQTDATAASPPPASKRLKTTKTSHVPAQKSIDYLVDEDARHGRKLEAKLTNGVPSSKTTRVDESHAVVAPDTRDQYHSNQVGSTPNDVISISSGEESSGDSGEEGDGELVPGGAAAEKPVVNGYAMNGKDEQELPEDVGLGAEDVDMGDGGAEDEEPEEPSFGEALATRYPDPIDVQASFPNPMADRQALIPVTGERTLSAPSGTTLKTVLTQALKTNDRDMLEKCFQTTNLNDIRLTIERLQSQHVVTLLQRLAERIYKRPGRTGSLITWVQWSLVAHGAYLASQPDVMKRLKSLSQVLRERANGLQPLLHLKGKLDMLSAQLELRQRMQAASRAANADDDEDDEGVVYVEGQDEDWSDSEADADGARVDSKMLELTSPKPKAQTATPRTDASSSEESESDDDMPNGVAQEAEDESSEEEDGGEGILDVEAEETSDDDSVEDESDDESISSAASEGESEPSDNESDEPGVKQPKPSTLNRKR
ncbi:Small subunit (SSU) processome component [Vermiconidia calcicola]|uniref:Small subunit (SSU) processome component n=1 Tax=Vermiconidia calcicola TaxID=1690605 RepID=A0ACC3MMT0_9PEZI|nr:Small subunit (SSU) processome component [Vermiconidia calcicola]